MASSLTAPPPLAEIDPGEMLAAVVGTVSGGSPYLEPAPRDRDVAVLGLARFMIGELTGARSLLEPLGFTVRDGVDPATGRRFAAATSETDETTARRWGLFLRDLSAPNRLGIAVPHPRSDTDCELLALRLWRAVPGSLLAMATVHRNARVGGTQELADQSRNPESIFHHLWTDVTGPRGVAQLQIHGFADATATEQVAVSTGIGPPTSLAVRIADGIAGTGLTISRSWESTIDADLRATANVQGVAAAAAGHVWVHIEHNRTVRTTAELWQPAVDAVAAAVRTEIGVPDS